jgi:type III restriction enzyme
MPDIIENPVINSPFHEPNCHYHFSETGITNQVKSGRRESVYFVPIPKPKQKSNQTDLSLETENEYRPNQLINDIRERIALWRKSDYRQATHITRRLLAHWKNEKRERRLFFCQLEALETIIYLTEIAPSHDADKGKYLLKQLDNAHREATPADHPILLKRYATKMATGSGKTVVMAMLIAWQCLNKIANNQDKRFTDAFLIVSPGITIKDRLRVLLPNDPKNYYQQLDIVPQSYLNELGKAKIVITNYHAFLLRERSDASTLTKKILTRNQDNPFKETPGQMVQRICGELGTKRQIIVLNDEAHHCYHKKPLDLKAEKLTGDDKKEAQQRDEEARVWIAGLEALAQKIGIKAVYDLSATPFFLKGSGYGEGTLFPWVVSDFSLTDAIESGIIKVPRVPVADNTSNEQPIDRYLWKFIGKELPKGTRKTKDLANEPQLPKQLEAALQKLYNHYQQAFKQWEQIKTEFDNTPPVFIVVCSNTTVSKLLFDWIAGWEKKVAGQTILVPGKLSIFSNVVDGKWTSRPNTILVDSVQLESGEALSKEFEKVTQREIEEFKQELKKRFNRDSDITPSELLREVMNTVGKKGKLGEQVKCVISVSMLSEGWDVNTVTHIMGVRAFSTQLLCEQVIGRGLRRANYETEPHTVTIEGKIKEFDAFPAEYADIYGVPFEFIPTTGGNPNSQPPKKTTQVYMVEEREAAMISFPRLLGYRHQIDAEQLAFEFTDDSYLTLSTKDLPTKTESAPIVGQTQIHNLNELKQRRLNEVAFLLARLLIERHFKSKATEHVIGGKIQNEVKIWLFPQLLNISKQWLEKYVICQDYTFKQLLLLTDYANTATDRIFQAIVKGSQDQVRDQASAPVLMPILQPHHTVGTTEGVNFHTNKAVYVTNEKSHLSHVVLDSQWEKKMLQTLEETPAVKAYVKNDSHLDFYIPYTFEGKQYHYLPDFIVKIDDGKADLLNLIVEVSGERRDDKDAKKATVEGLWIPAVNNYKQFGRWKFLEVKDPYRIVERLKNYGVQSAVL